MHANEANTMKQEKMSLNHPDFKMKGIQEKECSYIGQVQPPSPFYTYQDHRKIEDSCLFYNSCENRWIQVPD